MNMTIEVDLDHGRVTPTGKMSLPSKAKALLTILTPPDDDEFNPLVAHPLLKQISYTEDPTTPLSPEDWPEAFE